MFWVLFLHSEWIGQIWILWLYQNIIRLLQSDKYELSALCLSSAGVVLVMYPRPVPELLWCDEEVGEGADAMRKRCYWHRYQRYIWVLGWVEFPSSYSCDTQQIVVHTRDQNCWGPGQFLKIVSIVGLVFPFWAIMGRFRGTIIIIPILYTTLYWRIWSLHWLLILIRQSRLGFRD